MNITRREINKAVSDAYGKEALDVIRCLEKLKSATEFEVSEEIGIEVNKVRKLLYLLSESNLVGSLRKRDAEKGLYVYYWSFQKDNVETMIANRQKKKMSSLKEELEKEKNSTFFSCGNGCSRLVFEEAVDYDFRCPECGAMMSEDRNGKLIKELETKIQKLG